MAQRTRARRSAATRRIASPAPTPRRTSSSRSSATTSPTPGRKGWTAFKQQLGDWITHTLAQKYNGKSAPRIVLFSPIAHENLGNPDLPDGSENNQRLELYTKAMAEVAQARGVRFVDLFTPSRQLYAAGEAPLTINGVHLNAEGNRRIGEVIDRDLFGAAPAHEGDATSRRCGRPSSTRTFTGSTATGRPTGSPPSAIARS